ncbi:DUF58 domain-containing protein [Sphingosinicella sp. CPCC 101087]|uniref:DUF58 domain-containing protein n=1 Tax=Sphingosinicella sp. CPCC 101087 TaxID=2497754 RepID=UPI001FB15D69|nr:DUF58 domain-containing protein [Sphingosinicella sp. CPCC 101087]
MSLSFYPTRLAILLSAAVAPASLVIGLFLPAYWTAGLALLVLLLALAAIDLLNAPRLHPGEAICEGPAAVGVGEAFSVTARQRFGGAPPAGVELALGVDGPVAAPLGWRTAAEMHGETGSAAFVLRAERRGTARAETLWVRWTGPLGLAWKQCRLTLDQQILITPDIRPVREQGAQLFNRDSVQGQIAQRQFGEGAEFESLADFRQGMDRRAIDWKQSARHTKLIAKEYRTERNNQIVIALDAGRAMCEPLAARAAAGAGGEAAGPGLPRIDRAVSAALLTAFVALRDGDRVGLFAFDSRPRASSKPISGPRAFPMLQRIAAGIDYSTQETNYTLAMATLAEGLARRSLIVVFTEFPDTISAELMLNAVGTLLNRHLVLFVVFRDEELEAFTAAEPAEPEDVSRAVMAAGLLRERRLVLARLRHMGVQVIEASADEAGPALVNAYVAMKKRGAL